MNPPVSASQLGQLSLDELFEELGATLLEGSTGFADEDPRFLRNFGEDWFKRNIEKIRSRVCPHPKIQALVSDDGGDKVTGSVTAACEALGELTDSKQAATILAFIVLRYGIKKLCEPPSNPQ